ncbi:MAG: MYXO-CTERM domain-containing protein [Phycisphaerales bacterium]|jgi:MYXO-CTERM domain-containing protein
MNNLKLLGLTAGVGTLICAGNVTADFNGISWTMSSSAYGDTYLIYADLDAGSQLNAVYGDGDVALNIEGTGDFYQNMFGSATVAGMSPALIAVFPSLAYDSFVTIGLDTNVGNAMLDIGIDFSGFEAGGAIWTDNGSWFATPADPQVYEVDGQVLIGQFTVAAGESVSGTVNLQGKNAPGLTGGGTNWTALGTFNTAVVPAPGALALLGLAGIAARRRRK